MRIATALFSIVFIGGMTQAWAARDLTDYGGHSLPELPSQLSDPEERESYLQELTASLTANATTVQQKKDFNEEAFEGLMRQVHSTKGTGADQTFKSMQDTLHELDAALQESAPPERFREEGEEPPSQRQTLIRGAINKLMRIEAVTRNLPPTFVEFAQNYEKNATRVRGVVERMKEVIDQIEKDWDTVADEVAVLQTLIPEIEARLQDYQARAAAVEERMADPNISPEEKTFLRNRVLVSLKRAIHHLNSEFAIATNKMESRQQFLDYADPVMSDVKMNALLAPSAMASAAMIAMCNHRLLHAHKAGQLLGVAFDKALKAGSDSMLTTVKNLEKSKGTQLMTEAMFDRESKTHGEIRDTVERIDRKGYENVEAELQRSRAYTQKISETRARVDQLLDKGSHRLEQTRALPPRR